MSGNPTAVRYRPGNPLVDAVLDGDADDLRAALREDEDVDARDADGLTPLMIAAARGRADLVRLLLRAGADVCTTDSRAGATALHKACQGGSLEVVRLLLAAGALVDAAVAATGHSVLMEAVRFGRPELMAELLARGARSDGSTRSGSDLEAFTEAALAAAPSLPLRRCLELVGAQAAGRRRTEALTAAVHADDESAVRRLLGSGPVPPDVLATACRAGRHGLVTLLCEAGADLADPGCDGPALHLAARHGRPATVRLLAGRPGIDLDRPSPVDGYTALHEAVRHGHPECARALLEAGAGTELCGHDGRTPGDLAREFCPDDEALAQRLPTGP